MRIQRYPKNIDVHNEKRERKKRTPDLPFFGKLEGPFPI
jgi:hypothetical protein